MWDNHKPLLRSMLSTVKGRNTKISARKCVIKEVEIDVANAFLTRCHLYGASTSDVYLGLFYNNTLVQVVAFSSLPNKSNYYIFERLASELGTSVMGGASKLLKYFEGVYKPKIAYTYEVKNPLLGGNLNKILGFSPCSSKDGIIMLSKEYKEPLCTPEKMY